VVALYGRACAEAIAEACGKLAGIYERGDGVVKNLGYAEQLYDSGCAFGNGAACNQLARIREGARDLKGAAKLYRRACVRGAVAGCHALDRLYAQYRIEVPEGPDDDD